MSNMIWRTTLAAGLAAALAGCQNSPPGAGFTNGESPAVVAGEKPAERTDLPVPDAPSGDAPLAESAASSPAATGNAGGTGGRNMASPAVGPADSPRTPAPAGTPPRVETAPKGEPNTKPDR